jgi:hypothetical protein
MTVTIPFARQGLWTAEVEHRTTDSLLPGLDVVGTKSLELRVLKPSRILKVWGQPVNGNGGAGEQHTLYKVVRSYGRFFPIATTIGEAVSLAELAWTLSGEGVCAKDGIRIGSILRVTGSNTDTRTRVVRVTAITLTSGSADEITVEDVWTSVDRAFDTGATLELYSVASKPATEFEHVWLDVSALALVDEALDDDETAITLDSEGAAAAAGIAAGSIIRNTATQTGGATATEVMYVTSITLAGGQPDVINVVRGFMGTTALAFDNDASILEVLEGRITTTKDLNTVTDNTRFDPATLDDNQWDIEKEASLLSITTTNVEARVGLLMGPIP